MFPSGGDYRCVHHSPQSRTQTPFLLTNDPELNDFLQQALSSERAPDPVRSSESAPPPPSNDAQTPSRWRIPIPSLFTRSKPATTAQLSPSQILRNARSALLSESKSTKLQATHNLHKRTSKRTGSLKPYPPPLPAPKRTHPFPPPPSPRNPLLSLSRAAQRARVGDPTRNTADDHREAPHLLLKAQQIARLERALWHAREPRRELAGLGFTFMGPSGTRSCVAAGTVERWLEARTDLKMGVQPDRETRRAFETQCLYLLHPETGVPLGWEVRTARDGRPYFVQEGTGTKQWAAPRGTDVRRFKKFWA